MACRILVLAIGWCALLAARTQSAEVLAQQPTFRSSATVVPLQVTVTDRGRLVSGLGAGDFAVYENGVAQQLEFFDAGGVPLDVTLLLDVSWSMTGRFRTVQDAAVRFMSSLRGRDRGSVVTFNETFVAVQPFTSDGHLLERAIRSTRPSGSTSLLNAVYIALREATAARPSQAEPRREAIVVLSDGNDTASLVPFEDVLALAQNSGITLHVVTLRPIPEARRYLVIDPKAEYHLNTLARDTGAAAYFLDEAEQLRTALTQISSELATTYSLAYSPTGAGRGANDFRRIQVKVVSNPAYRARTRSGYTSYPTRLGNIASWRR